MRAKRDNFKIFPNKAIVQSESPLHKKKVNKFNNEIFTEMSLQNMLNVKEIEYNAKLNSKLMNFKQEIEKKYQNSYTNANYVFPRKFHLNTIKTKQYKHDILHHHNHNHHHEDYHHHHHHYHHEDHVYQDTSINNSNNTSFESILNVGRYDLKHQNLRIIAKLFNKSHKNDDNDDDNKHHKAIIMMKSDHNINYLSDPNNFHDLNDPNDLDDPHKFNDQDLYISKNKPIAFNNNNNINDNNNINNKNHDQQYNHSMKTWLSHDIKNSYTCCNSVIKDSELSKNTSDNKGNALNNNMDIKDKGNLNGLSSSKRDSECISNIVNMNNNVNIKSGLNKYKNLFEYLEGNNDKANNISISSKTPSTRNLMKQNSLSNGFMTTAVTSPTHTSATTITGGTTTTSVFNFKMNIGQQVNHNAAAGVATMTTATTMTTTNTLNTGCKTNNERELYTTSTHNDIPLYSDIDSSPEKYSKKPLHILTNNSNNSNMKNGMNANVNKIINNSNQDQFFLYQIQEKKSKIMSNNNDQSKTLAIATAMMNSPSQRGNLIKNIKELTHLSTINNTNNNIQKANPSQYLNNSKKHNCSQINTIHNNNNNLNIFTTHDNNSNNLIIRPMTGISTPVSTTSKNSKKPILTLNLSAKNTNTNAYTANTCEKFSALKNYTNGASSDRYITHSYTDRIIINQNLGENGQLQIKDKPTTTKNNKYNNAQINEIITMPITPKNQNYFYTGKTKTNTSRASVEPNNSGNGSSISRPQSKSQEKTRTFNLYKKAQNDLLNKLTIGNDCGIGIDNGNNIGTQPLIPNAPHSTKNTTNPMTNFINFSSNRIYNNDNLNSCSGNQESNQKQLNLKILKHSTSNPIPNKKLKKDIKHHDEPLQNPKKILETLSNTNSPKNTSTKIHLGSTKNFQEILKPVYKHNRDSIDSIHNTNNNHYHHHHHQNGQIINKYMPYQNNLKVNQSKKSANKSEEGLNLYEFNSTGATNNHGLNKQQYQVSLGLVNMDLQSLPSNCTTTTNSKVKFQLDLNSIKKGKIYNNNIGTMSDRINTNNKSKLSEW